MEKSKGSATTAVVVVLVLGLVRASAGAVYTVGDSAGWTIVGNINYTAWATTKEFLFVYNNNFHNVMEVSKADYKACNAASPLSTHKSGNDSFVIKRAGHHFFICGVPGHCAIGQKVDIRVPKVASSAAPSATPTTSPSAGGGAIGVGGGASTGTTPVSSPRPNSAAAVAPPALLGLALLAVFASAAAVSAAVL
ncbi:Mavicyanin [Ananas comosus]|uniref:Mavicyanin n=1 Tax=Ananas comosus TaxID=4615 RepID=A0A199W837_ANACO|nr:Mavicyanin [Ananas comosus]